MSQIMDRERARNLSLVGGLALIVLLVSAILLWLDARQAWKPDVAGPVFTDWATQVAMAEEIRISGPESRFEIVRASQGWRMPSRDDYAVDGARIAQLDTLLAGLVYEGARTADPDKHDRLGLLEPGSGERSATRVSVLNGAGETLIDVLLGDQRDNLVYLRFPGRERTYAARLPEGVDASILQAPADAWLGLDFLALGRTEIALVEISPERGPAYRLERAGQNERNFSLRSPAGWQPITAGAGNGPAAGTARLRFRDVRDADRLNGALVASHRAETFGGLSVRLDIIAQGETRWALIRVDALSDDAGDLAESLLARTEGWAYLLSDLSIDRLTRPLDEIATQREIEDAP